MYATVGIVPYISNIWTDKYEIIEGDNFTVFSEIFSQDNIINVTLYYKFNDGPTYNLSMIRASKYIWASEPIICNYNEGSIFEYWIQLAYDDNGIAKFYPTDPIYYSKTIIGYDAPIISNVHLSDGYPFKKGDIIDIFADVYDESIKDVYCSYFVTNQGFTNNRTIGEVGEVTVGGTPVTVTFQNEYINPVVVAVPKLSAGVYRSGSATAQHHVIYDVTSTGFTIVQREDGVGPDDVVDASPIVWWVMEEGVYTIDGLTYDVGTTIANGNYKSIAFSASFSSTSTILDATQTDNNGIQVRTRIKDLVSTSFSIQVEAQDQSIPTLANYETVGYIAISQGSSGTTNDLEAALTGDAITNAFTTVSYSTTFTSTPYVIAHLNKEDGSHPCYAVIRDVTTTDFKLADEEPNNYDDSHTTEVLGWVAIGQEYSFEAFIPMVILISENSTGSYMLLKP